MPTDLLTTAQAAKALGVSRSTIRRMVKAGDLIATKPGGYARAAFMFEREAIEAMASTADGEAA